MCTLNSAKIGAPFRADVRLNVARIVTDCEVDDESKQPFKDMRYPLENGVLHQELLAQRNAWFQKELGFDQTEAAEWTNKEFTAFFGTLDELVKKSDPARLIYHLRNNDFDQNLITKAQKETEAFYATVFDGLILTTPMKTYAKHRFYHGIESDLYNANECPEPVEYWVANTPAINNWLSQLNLKGDFSLQEEQKTIQIQKSMVFSAKDFGQLAQNLKADNSQNQDYLQAHLLDSYKTENYKERIDNY